MMNDRVYVPPALRGAVLAKLHAAHNGISLTKQLARKHVYWPDITKDIENLIRSCTACIQTSKTPIKAPLASWNKSMNPGDRVHMDFAGPLLGQMLLVIVDSCSKWLDVKVLLKANSRNTIRAFERYVADNGLPRLLVTDNGSQFSSNEFEQFCKRHGIKHMKSPVYHPQSNGQAERMVDVVKRFVKKNILRFGPNMNMEDCMNEFLLGYRSTPSTATPENVSPAVAHIGRDLRNSLDLLKPQLERNLAPDEKMENQYNQQYGTRYRHFIVNDYVWARKKKDSPWFEGRINARRGSRMFEIVDKDGKCHRLHTNQLLKRWIPGEPLGDTVADSVDQTPIPDEIALTPTSNSDPVASTHLNNSVSPAPQTRRSTRIRRKPSRFNDYYL